MNYCKTCGISVLAGESCEDHGGQEIYADDIGVYIPTPLDNGQTAVISHSWCSYNYGWVCPKCQNVYAPHVTECHKCNGYTEPVVTWSTVGNQTQKITYK